MNGAAPLIGREDELTLLASVVEDARRGRSRTLVVAGPAGVGKTALLDRAVTFAEAAGTRVERVVAPESEFDLPYAGLHQLTARVLDPSSTALPAPQRRALDAAFGRDGTTPPAPILVGLATLGLLTEAAVPGPLVCVVDDAHWLDPPSSQALTFAARRIEAEGVVLLFATRTIGADLDGLPTLQLSGLEDSDARRLLARALPDAVDERVRDQLLTEAAGNPLALVELPRALSPAELAGGFALAKAVPLEQRIEASMLARLERLSADARRLLLLAAADPTGDPALLWAAARHAGLTADALATDEASEALSVDTRVRFRHPLVRSAVYRGASADARRTAHATLAAVTDGDNAPDRRAWHQAHAVALPDEAVAAELERSAARARIRGGAAAAAAFLERAADLSVSPEHRARRALEAARAKFDAGAFEDARQLCAGVRRDALSPVDGLMARRLELEIDFQLQRDATTMARGLAEVAGQLDRLDRARARETYLQAVYAAFFLGKLGDRPLADEISRPVLEAAAGILDEPAPASADLLLVGQALHNAGERDRARPVLRDALQRLLSHPPQATDLAWLAIACHAAIATRDLDAFEAASARAVDLSRSGGELRGLPLFSSFEGAAMITRGRLHAARANLDDVKVARQLTRDPYPPYPETLVAAWCGDAAAFETAVTAMRRFGVERGEGNAVLGAGYTEAVFANGTGDFARAVRAARWEHTNALQATAFYGQLLGELAEAAARTGELELAQWAADELEAGLGGLSTAWARGGVAEARAQVLAGTAAEAAHQEAIDRFEHGGLTVYAARARLTFGEWLRRRQRLAEAREQLRAAHLELSRAGAVGFAARAARELQAAGEATYASTLGTGAELTSHERNVVRLARDGLTNRDIAAHLFVSERTVEYHLRKVFQKLGIRSRRELQGALEPAR